MFSKTLKGREKGKNERGVRGLNGTRGKGTWFQGEQVKRGKRRSAKGGERGKWYKEWEREIGKGEEGAKGKREIGEEDHGEV